MRLEIEKIVEKFGQENPPPPAQVFTIANNQEPGNIHYVQKVFRGPFEVRFHQSFRRLGGDTKDL